MEKKIVCVCMGFILLVNTGILGLMIDQTINQKYLTKEIQKEKQLKRKWALKDREEKIEEIAKTDKKMINLKDSLTFFKRMNEIKIVEIYEKKITDRYNEIRERYNDEHDLN